MKVYLLNMHHPPGNARCCMLTSTWTKGVVRWSARCNKLQGLHMQEEFLSIMLPSHGKRVQRPEHSSDLLHHAVTPKGMQTPRPFQVPAVLVKIPSAHC
jgi:hypothetical protein